MNAIEKSVVYKFVSEKIPFLKIIKDILPVWKYLLFHTGAFFGAVRQSDKLSLTNAAIFSFNCATFLTLVLAAVDNIAKMISEKWLDRGDYKAVDFVDLIIIEALAFSAIWIISIITAAYTFLAARTISKDIIFKRIFIGTIYMQTFSITISFCFAWLIIFVGVISPEHYTGDTSIFDITILGSDGGLLYSVLIALNFIWNRVFIPVFALAAAAYMTNMRPRTVFLLQFAYFFMIILTVIAVLYISYVIFS